MIHNITTLSLCINLVYEHIIDEKQKKLISPLITYYFILQ